MAVLESVIIIVGVGRVNASTIAASSAAAGEVVRCETPNREAIWAVYGREGVCIVMAVFCCIHIHDIGADKQFLSECLRSHLPASSVVLGVHVPWEGTNVETGIGAPWDGDLRVRDIRGVETQMIKDMLTRK